VDTDEIARLTRENEILKQAIKIADKYNQPVSYKGLPGIKLDEQIAKDVLGWFRKSNVGGDRSWWRIEGKTIQPVHLNCFSSDIKAAWLLVQMFRLCILPWEGWWTAFQEHRVYHDASKNAAPTAPHAICLAALNIGNLDDAD